MPLLHHLFTHMGRLVLCLGLMILSACGSANRLLKARAVTLTPFFEHPQFAQDARKQLGFQKVWTTPNRAVLAEGLTKRKLYIAPVTLAYLRPVDKAFATQEISWGLNRQERDIAHRLQVEFLTAFRRSPRAIYQLVPKPGPDTLTLQLALTELNPTSPKGNAMMTMLKVAVTPVAALGGWFTKGNMAIEGKMLVSQTGRTFFQFADNEADKLTFLSARDYQPYGHPVHSMRDWAVRFEEMTRTPSGMQLKDSSAVTLRLY